MEEWRKGDAVRAAERLSRYYAITAANGHERGGAVYLERCRLGAALSHWRSRLEASRAVGLLRVTRRASSRARLWRRERFGSWRVGALEPAALV